MKLTLVCIAALVLSANGTAIGRPSSRMRGTESRRLQRRFDEANDATWNRDKCKGKAFLDAMPLSDEEAGANYSPPQSSAQSHWRGDLKSDLASWGWKEAQVPKSGCAFDTLAYGDSWVKAAKELSIGTEGWKDIWCYRFTHGSTWDVLGNKQYEIDGKDYPYTGAYGTYGINAGSGAIFAMDNLMPGSAIKRNKQRPPQDGEEPKLRALSDLLWAGWYRGSQPSDRNNANLGNIKYLIGMSVTNAETNSIILRALKAKGKSDIALWPGVDFDMSEEEGQALLGSPNGRRWGYFLTQRKNDIGIKTISKVTVFRGREGGNAIMVFHVSDIVAPSRRRRARM